MSREKPILFSTPIVQAILAGRKTMTRRVIKPQPTFVNSEYGYTIHETPEKPFKELNCPYGQGDILWVRETWWADNKNLTEARVFLYKADAPFPEGWSSAEEYKWKPSIYMPRSAARIFLKVTNVRVERLQDITEEDAKAEGIRSWTKDGELYKYGHIEPGDPGSTPWQEMPRTAKEAFNKLWDEINSKRGYGWDTNPWVWVIEFERAQHG